MWKILATSITILSLFSCATVDQAARSKPYSEDLEKARKLVLSSDYDQAELHLIKLAKLEDENYNEAVLLLGKVYDQTGRPEKAILNLREFLNNKSENEAEKIQARALLMKNWAKLRSSANVNREKKEIALLMTDNKDKVQNLEALLGTLNFNCGIYCVEEVNYLKEIQLQLLYTIEADSSLYPQISESLISKYNFFESCLKESKLSVEFRKNIGFALYDALQKLKSSHLEMNTLASVKTAELINHLEASQKRIERWLYE